MKNIMTIICACLISANILAQSIQHTADALTSDPTLSHASIGISIINGNGDRLAGSNENKLMVPASVLKLITTGAAIHSFGPDFRFKTDIRHDGFIENGILHGNIYIRGNGDPTIGSKDSIATDLNTLFATWKGFIQKKGIKKIEGHIIGDGRWLEGMSEEPTWLWNDIGTYYGSGVTGLMFYENMQSFSVSPGEEIGTPVNIKPFYPECPWMTFRYDCTTGLKGTGDKLYMYTSGLSPVAEIRGTFGIDRGKKRVDCSNKYPEYTCAVYFYNYLKKNGIVCSDGCGDYKLKTEWMEETSSADSLILLGTTFSPSLERIVHETNHASNNLFAETLFRTLGKEMRQSSCYDSSYLAMNDILKKLMPGNENGIKMQDGSGLSRQNHISADFMTGFLRSMMDSPHFDKYLSSLPFPGDSGTMSYNMKGYSEGLRHRIRVKSGSMNGIRCYCGYILPEGFIYKEGLEIPEEVKKDIVIFSILTNNCISPNWKVRPLLDRFMAAIAKS